MTEPAEGAPRTRVGDHNIKRSAGSTGRSYITHQTEHTKLNTPNRDRQVYTKAHHDTKGGWEGLPQDFFFFFWWWGFELRHRYLLSRCSTLATPQFFYALVIFGEDLTNFWGQS
jgi:hypothetical protein